MRIERARKKMVDTVIFSKGIRQNLIDDGWVTPNTYCNSFEKVTNISAVYLLMLAEKLTADESLIAYVGMSKKLLNRVSNHNILPQLRELDYFVSTWFKPVDVSDLRGVEQFYIEKFNPPWNIIGKKRGII